MKKEKSEAQAFIDYRKENFTVRVEKGVDYLTKIPQCHLSISPNGRQFISLEFSKEEWKQIKKKVNELFKQEQ